MGFQQQLDQAATNQHQDLCTVCGADRTGALFRCPHCGANGTGICMKMNEDEMREFQYAQSTARHHGRQGFMAALCSIFLPGIWIRHSR